MPRPKLEGVLETALYVDDLDRSVRFYESIFGFKVIDSGGRLAALSVASKQVLLPCKKRASANLPLGAHDGDGQLHLAFAISTTELETWEGWLEQKGVAIEEKRTWDFGGRSLYFRDPDQHLIEVATPGVWSIY